MTEEKRDPGSDDGTKDVDPTEKTDDQVDQESEESFPASDPPSW